MRQRGRGHFGAPVTRRTDEQLTADMIAYLPFDCLPGAVFIEGLPEGTVIEFRVERERGVPFEPCEFTVRRESDPR